MVHLEDPEALHQINSAVRKRIETGAENDVLPDACPHRALHLTPRHARPDADPPAETRHLLGGEFRADTLRERDPFRTGKAKRQRVVEDPWRWLLSVQRARGRRQQRGLARIARLNPRIHQSDIVGRRRRPSHNYQVFRHYGENSTGWRLGQNMSPLSLGAVLRIGVGFMAAAALAGAAVVASASGAAATVSPRSQAVTPCTTPTLTASPGSPQPAGTAITLTATTSGCASPAYRFWYRQPGYGWSIVQDYGSANTFV